LIVRLPVVIENHRYLDIQTQDIVKTFQQQ